MSNVIEILKKSKEVIAEYGWTAGDLKNSDGCVCALGAIGVASGHEERMEVESYAPFVEDGVAKDAANALAAHIYATEEDYYDWLDAGEVDYDIVHGYNDGHTEADVLALFDSVIERLEDAA
ncbi:DUF6197 family protein [Mycobacteroides salmoniphilum]|uniref:DUF6197 family protein n=1 Tax=Mycobacteroides salmoniphilum TaxID=404941 RepID=UPI00099280BD|nr:hypothetical protein [Mycobacteroides salmoniphilum]